MKKALILLSGLIILVACSEEVSTINESSTKEVKTEDIITETAEELPSLDNEYLISKAQAGELQIGEAIPAEFQGFIMRVVQETRKFPGSEAIEDAYLYSDGAIDFLKIYKSYESSPEDPTIGEIVVYSSKYETSEGISTESTIKDVFEQWPEGTFSYSPWNNEYSFYTKEHTCRFIIPEEAYTGKAIDPSSDQVSTLSFEDFNTESTLEAIWVLAR